MMKDVEFSCMQKVMISSELFSCSAEDIFLREILFWRQNFKLRNAISRILSD